MKTRKTNSNSRTTYTYFFVTGERIQLFPESSRADYSEVITVFDDERFVPDEMIRELHLADDRAVYNENKNCKVLYQDWERPMVLEWQSQHPGEKVPKRYHLSLESILSEETIDEDKLRVQAQVLSPADEEEPEAIERLRSIVDGFTEQQKKIYCLVFLMGFSGRKAGCLLKIPEATIRRRITEIKMIIADDPVLKKIYTE